MNKSRQAISNTSTPARPTQNSFLHCGNSRLTLDGNESAQCCKDHKPEILQRAPVPPFARNSQVNDVSPIVQRVLGSPGQPLDAGTRVFMEPRFGHDFSQVRVHADTKAAESARDVNALAYTVGRDMVFGQGQYAPSTYAGRQLVAHEMAHVVQQQASTQAQGSIQRRVVVQNPDQRPPRAPATATNASIISNYAGTLCSGFSVNASGVMSPPSNIFCTSAGTTSTPESCRCLCYMTSLKDATGNDVEWKVFVADDQWPHTHFPTRSVYVHSPYSGLQFGAWSAGPNVHRMTQDNWLVFGHELCGHGWLYEQGRHPTTQIIADDARVTHDPTVEIENRIAGEHGIPASEQRGLWATGGRHHGESLASVTITSFPSGSADFYSTPPAEQQKLNIVRDFMRSTPSVVADVIGHADQPASSPTINQTISNQRAANVRAILISRGIAASRFVSIVGKADTECPAPGQQPLCRNAVVYMFNYRAASDNHG